jgi:N-acetylglucosamine kinase-like BadF-type ATPase
MCAQAQGPSVNPSTVGREEAKQRIQSAIQAALSEAKLTSDDVAAVAIGVAGADKSHSEQWLIEIISGVLPTGIIVPSSDMEIALVGAHGKREGAIIVAGTGSIAYAIHRDGTSARVGGWGYLVDDTGSGYWIGREALRAVLLGFDGRGQTTDMTGPILAATNVQQPLDLIGWLYGSPAPRIRDIAGLAPVVLEYAERGDAVAGEIIEQAASELALLGSTVVRRVGLPATAIAFMGGLLEHDNLLSQRLCALLGLSEIPKARHDPVMGAALLARMVWEQSHNPAK